MTWRVEQADCIEAMAEMGEASVDAVVCDLDCGTAGEHLVCADLLLGGWRAFRTDQGCPYDVAVEVDGRLVRLQVKTTRGLRSVPQRVNHRQAYIWHLRHGKARKPYEERVCDLAALVALDVRRIAYLPISEAGASVVLRSHDDPSPPAHGGKGGRTFDDLTIYRALAVLGATQ